MTDYQRSGQCHGRGYRYTWKPANFKVAHVLVAMAVVLDELIRREHTRGEEVTGQPVTPGSGGQGGLMSDPFTGVRRRQDAAK